MKKFNLIVETKVVTEEACAVSVTAETLSEAREIAEQMFNNNELQFFVVDYDVERLYISEQ